MKSRTDIQKRLRTGLLLAVLAGATLPAQAVTLKAGDGVAVTLDSATHRYTVESQSAGWKFSGTVGGAVGDIKTSSGSDAIGPFHGLRFKSDGLTGTIQAYTGKPLVLFGITVDKDTTAGLPAFPSFTQMPGGLTGFSYREAVFAPPSFRLEQNATPWLLFDPRDEACIISPADNFFLSRMSGDGTNLIASGLNPGATNLPAGFTHRTLLAFGHGINATWDGWGRALTDLQGKTRPANDADPGLRYLGYWTDNGAAYYYNYDTNLGYAGTLEALVKHYRDRAIPIRYLQLDSWWYYKSLTGPDGQPGKVKNPKLPEGEWNRYGGLLKYEAHPAVFPDGLAGFQRQVGLPLVTHNRWIDPASPYHDRFKISGVAAVDREFWDGRMDYIHQAGVACYEQDWLNCLYNYSPALQVTPGLGEAFSDGMAGAAKDRGMSLQYCMGLPRNFLQGSHYGNLTTIRTSQDRFSRERWVPFLYTSRLASALGIWPWADVFMSTEKDNLLIATLSAGMVGTGDAIGAENKENLMLAARPDGVLVKPDAPLLPTDATYLAETADPQAPFVATTYTRHGDHRTAYVFAFNRRGTNCPVAFRPSEFGLAGEVWVYEPATRNARKISADTGWTVNLERRVPAFFVIAPAGPAGLAFFGDAGKFVSTGRQRISAIKETEGRLTVTVNFAAGESEVRLFGYAAHAPNITAAPGAVLGLLFDAASGRFEFTVAPAPGIITGSPGTDPIRQARVRITAG